MLYVERREPNGRYIFENVRRSFRIKEKREGIVGFQLTLFADFSLLEVLLYRERYPGDRGGTRRVVSTNDVMSGINSELCGHQPPAPPPPPEKHTRRHHAVTGVGRCTMCVTRSHPTVRVGSTVVVGGESHIYPSLVESIAAAARQQALRRSRAREGGGRPQTSGRQNAIPRDGSAGREWWPFVGTCGSLLHFGSQPPNVEPPSYLSLTRAAGTQPILEHSRPPPPSSQKKDGTDFA